MEHDEISQDAEDILGDVLQWTHHGPHNWSKVDVQLQRLYAGIKDGDQHKTWQATTELELLSPLRCFPPRRDPDATPIPAPTAVLVGQVQAALAASRATKN